MSLLIDLGADSVNKGVKKGMTMVNLQERVFQQFRVKCCTRLQLNVKLSRFSRTAALER